MQLISSVSDDSILSDICLNNHRNLPFDDFFAIAEKEIEKMQATAINDCCHAENSRGEDNSKHAPCSFSKTTAWNLCKRDEKQLYKREHSLVK